jgi:hypothetical protein
MNARHEAGHDEKFHAPRLRGDEDTNTASISRLVDDRVLPQSRDLVLNVQFFSLQFRNLQVVGGRMGESLVDFLLQRLVPSFKFRKMRFDRHVA